MQKELVFSDLTHSLEDYLETVYELIRDNKVARVRDIAKARDVKASSVTPAMRRLDDLGLIKYERREFIELTEEGEKIARRVYSRHQILERFFKDFLGLTPKAAEENACAMEHSLTNEAMEHFVRLFEFIRICPPGKELLEKYRMCCEVHHGQSECTSACTAKSCAKNRKEKERTTMSLFELKPGEKGKVKQINAKGAIRRRMLDMGILPDTVIELERVAPTGDPVWIKLGGYQMSLRKTEADSVVVAMI